jgi:hypothetical protein
MDSNLVSIKGGPERAVPELVLERDKFRAFKEFLHSFKRPQRKGYNL